MKCKILLFAALLFFACNSTTPDAGPQHIRFASYNVAMFRSEPGALAKALQSGRDTQIQNVATVIQRVRPDVLLLLEFDYDASEKLLQDFQQHYLQIAQQGEAPISFAYHLQVPSNTGVLADADFNGDGKIERPNDAYGFGQYEGQYAFALLSKFPIDTAELRSFQYFLWKNMPDAKAPKNADGSAYYSEAAWNSFRLSSKNHIDIPIQVSTTKTIHAIVAHPTPPVFDGPEDRNGLRNYDEIRLLKDYISNAEYLVDDRGNQGGLTAAQSFIVMGDLNADPIDGDSAPGAIAQLLDAPRVNAEAAKGKFVPASKGGKAYNQRPDDKGDPAFDTAFFGSRIDYLLPSSDLQVQATGVFWPAEGEDLYDLVKDKGASDHLLIWLDVAE